MMHVDFVTIETHRETVKELQEAQSQIAREIAAKFWVKVQSEELVKVVEMALQNIGYEWEDDKIEFAAQVLANYRRGK